MIVLYPDNESAQVITFDELRQQLIAAYAKHKDNLRIKNKRCEVSSEDINFVISYWVAELPKLFTKALDLKMEHVVISYDTYPRYFDQEHDFLVNLIRKAYPSFFKILQSMNVRVAVAHLEGECPQVRICTEEIKKFINGTSGADDIDDLFDSDRKNSND